MEDAFRLQKTKVERLAKEFNLKFRPAHLRASIMAKKDFVKLLYLLGCPAEPYNSFGRTVEERVKDYTKFVLSKEFRHETNKPGGTVIFRKSIKKIAAKIKDKEVEREFKSIISNLRLYGSLPLGIITRPQNQREKRMVSVIIFHEWIHALLLSNNISFQKIRKDYWNFDEGLTECMQLFPESESKDFEKRIRDRLGTDSGGMKIGNYTKHIFSKMLFWNKLLKDKSTPKERREAIFNVMKRLKVT